MAKARLSKEERIKQRKRFRRKLNGFIFLMLAVIGVAAIVSFVIRQVNLALDDSDEIAAYEQLYAPLVALDPVAFVSLENADPDRLLEAAIFTALQTEDTGRYARDEFGRILLPALDVDRFAARLYGPKYRITHRTFGGSGYLSEDQEEDFSAYNYLSEQQAYAVPITSMSGSFVPRIESIARSGNTKILTVAYMQAAGDVGAIITDPGSMTPAKYMDYVLLKEGSDFFLYSIRDHEESE